MTRTLVASPDPDPEDPFPDLYVTHVPDPSVNEEAVGEVLNVLFNPNLTWGGLANVLAGKDTEGWALLRVVPVNSYESVAVFERWQ